MIQHIKLSKYKGIESVILKELGHINVICGKNNSGKSSILEAMTKNDSFGIGKNVDESLKGLFKPLIQNLSSPAPNEVMQWFNKLIDDEIKDSRIWYSSEINSINKHLESAKKQNPYLERYSNFVDFEVLLRNFFLDIIENYKPFLIPPKRSISFETSIKTDSEIDSSGEGIINRLFFFKNQDLKSDDYILYKSIYDEFEFITGRHFNIVPKKGNIIELKFSNEKNRWLPAKDCGLGLSEILIILGLICLTNRNTFLIEEPENHLHAEYQKKLIDFLRRQNDIQFFLATHSNIFIDPNYVNKVIYTEYIDNVEISDVTSRSSIISSLGYSVSDNLYSDLIILTEGPTDVPILKEILAWKKLDIPFNIKYWPLGGDVMGQLDLEVIAQDHSVIAIIDSDPHSQGFREAFKEKCKSLNIKCFQLKRYAIENYLSLKAIRSAFKNQVPIDLEKIDHNKSIKDQLGFNIKSKNYQIIKHMSMKDFEETDLIEFCEMVETILKQNVT